MALDLWNLISNRIDQDTFERRTNLANGWEGNGFELWCRFFQDYEGGDELVQDMAELSCRPTAPSLKGPT